MKLYSCGQTTNGASVGHPCGRAIVALRDAGHDPQIEIVDGYRALPWTRWGKREHLYDLSGQRHAPVLVTDDGTVVAGSGRIVAWARANPVG